MSDEERIEQLELEVKVLRANNKGLKDKIDEQSKEIEELKKPKYIIDCKTGEITTLTNDFVSKDKIKAEIEELKNMKVDGEVFTTAVNFGIKVLQSLLEKE